MLLLFLLQRSLSSCLAAYYTAFEINNSWYMKEINWVEGLNMAEPLDGAISLARKNDMKPYRVYLYPYMQYSYSSVAVIFLFPSPFYIRVRS